MSLSSRLVTAASNTLRSLGQSLDRTGRSLEITRHTDRLVPSSRFVAVDGVLPTVSPETAFVAPSASIIGDVKLESNVSVWYGATVRGDVNSVTIGENTSVGDRAVIHVAKIAGDFPTVIGRNVCIGPGAIVHAATLKENVVIGPSAQILDGAVIEERAVIEAGAVVTPGTVVPAGEVWGGNPASSLKKVTAEETATAASMANDTLHLARMHALENSKDYIQLMKDEEYIEDATTRDPDYYPYQPEGAREEGDVLGQGSPGLIFDSVLTNPEEGLKMMEERRKKKKAEEAA